MEIQQYIESGILEEYCLGLLSEQDEAYFLQMTMLYPEIKAELTALEVVFEKLAESTSIEPAPAVKSKILGLLGFNDFVDGKFPITTKDSDYRVWLEQLADLIPSEPSEDFWCEVIRQDEKVQQMLVVTKNDVPEEDHQDYKESFFILKGHCECTVGDDVINLFAGDFLEIPLNLKHDIKIMSPHVVAILQYQFV